MGPPRRQGAKFGGQVCGGERLLATFERQSLPRIDRRKAANQSIHEAYVILLVRMKMQSAPLAPSGSTGMAINRSLATRMAPPGVIGCLKPVSQRLP